MDIIELSERARSIQAAVETAVVGKSEVVEAALAVLLANGHLLIEDIPGVGKTTMAKALSRALGLTFKRIQFTPDLLPGDITGSSIYNQKSAEFELRPGPIFSNIVLADEINRTTPKTQAALLECMEERQVTIDGVSLTLPSPFFVIATQNNIELAGTYPLPEAQLDRFGARLTLGYPSREAEAEILSSHQERLPIESVQAATNELELQAMQKLVRTVHVGDNARKYILDIVEKTRTHSAVQLGASPRGALSLMAAAQSRAAMLGNDKVTDDEIKAMATATLAHRIQIRPEQRVRGLTQEALMAEILAQVAVP